MSKIASSCENCIFSKRYPVREKPTKTAKEIWAEKTFWQRFWGDYALVRINVAFQNAHYNDYVNQRICTRFPKFEGKSKNDFCGEHQPN
jgi:hypothetical protein